MKITPPFNVVLVEPEIPPNTGSIARLCGATDSILHLVKPLGFSTDDRYLKRAGLDYWQFVRIIYWESFEAFLEKQPEKRLHFLSKKVSRPYYKAVFQPGDYLVFGKETKGLPVSLRKWFVEQKRESVPGIESVRRSAEYLKSRGML